MFSLDLLDLNLTQLLAAGVVSYVVKRICEGADGYIAAAFKRMKAWLRRLASACRKRLPW